MSTKTIRVQGRGAVAQTPDKISLLLSIEEKQKDFSSAIDGANLRIETCRLVAEEVGISPDQIKTSDFGVADDEEYEHGRRNHIGYLAKHTLRILLPIDKTLVGKFLSSLARSKAKPEITLAFIVSDTEAVRKKLLADAVVNAKSHAQTIVETAGVSLGSIVNIEHGYSEIRVSSAENNLLFSEAATSDIDFDPEDISAEDSVTITWEIAG